MGYTCAGFEQVCDREYGIYMVYVNMSKGACFYMCIVHAYFCGWLWRCIRIRVHMYECTHVCMYTCVGIDV